MKRLLLLLVLSWCCAASSAWFFRSLRQTECELNVTMTSHKTGVKIRRQFNVSVIRAERWERPMNPVGGWQSFASKIGFKHSGVVVKLANNKRFLVHKGNECDVTGRTVVIRPRNLTSRNWRRTSRKMVCCSTLADYVRASGKYYNLIFDNCHHASRRMMRLPWRHQFDVITFMSSLKRYNVRIPKGSVSLTHGIEMSTFRCRPSDECSLTRKIDVIYEVKLSQRQVSKTSDFIAWRQWRHIMDTVTSMYQDVQYLRHYMSTFNNNYMAFI